MKNKYKYRPVTNQEVMLHDNSGYVLKLLKVHEYCGTVVADTKQHDKICPNQDEIKEKK